MKRWLLSTLFALSAGLAVGDEPKPEAKWAVDRSLAVTPALPPSPALRYRLLPIGPELKPGNAAPIYLRLVHEQSDASRKAWTEKPNRWNDLPAGEFPVAEAREFLRTFSRMLQQLDLAAIRRECEWEYTLDQGSVIDILLPDAQNMRNYTPLLLTRVRKEVAEADYPAAARSFRTGLAFSRNLARGPFLINKLVGAAAANQFIDRVPEWIEQPGAPNLYWSLTALPRPLIDLKSGFEFEERVLELQFPELADLDHDRTAADWSTLLRRIRRLRIDSGLGELPAPPAGTGPEDPAEKSPDLLTARKYLVERGGHAKAAVDAMTPAETLVRWIVGEHREWRDEAFKSAYLEYPEGQRAAAAFEERFRKAPDTEAVRLTKALLPAVPRPATVQNRLDRKVAALRVVEALRAYAAAHAGKLPDRLADVQEVPVPADPGTGKPFEYARDGDAAVVTGRVPGEPDGLAGIRYRVTVRK